MPFFRRPVPQVAHLFDRPHWYVGAVRDLETFFGNLEDVTPDGAVLCLAGGGSPERRRFLHEHALRNAAAPMLPAEFAGAPQVPADAERLMLLSSLAARHAPPEIAIHLAVFAADRAILEWYDVPADPIAIALDVPEDAVARFARHGGVSYRRDGCPPEPEAR